MRTNSVKLPSVNELEEIMQKELWIDPPKEKFDVHYPNFSSVNKWLEHIGIQNEIFTTNLSWQEIISQGAEIEPLVKERTLELTTSSSKKIELLKLLKNVTDYLGEEDILEKSNVIFVFGSKSETRIIKAIKLFKENIAPLLFISGGSPHYEAKQISEAEVFKNIAITNGVPEKLIIIEPESITIADNVRRSLKYMNENNINYEKMIIVTAWFAMRRSWAFMMKYIPRYNEVVRCASDLPTDSKFRKDNWWENGESISVIFNEYVKLRTGISVNSC